MLKAYDAAYEPNLAAVKAAGGVAINHYLTGGYASTTTPTDAARAAGLGVILTYEVGASELVNATRAQGQDIGHRILAAVQSLPTVPPLDGSVAVYVSVDTNAPAASCDAGFLGVRDVLAGKLSLRAYAEGAIVDHLAANGITQGKGWLAAPKSWPGFNAADSNVCMVQQVGSDVPGTDLNLITDINALGAWWPDDSPYGDDVALTPDQTQALSLDTAHPGSPSIGAIWAAIRALQNDTTHANTLATIESQVAALATAVAQIQQTLANLAPGSSPAAVPTKFTGTVSLQAAP